MEEKIDNVTRKDTIEILENLGVQIADEDAPFGKIKNASIMLEEYRPIYIKARKSLINKFAEFIKSKYNWKS